MAKVNNDYMVEEYTSDISTTVYPNINFKIGGDITGTMLENIGYVARPTASRNRCSNQSFFKMRNIVANFSDGTQHQFPVPEPTLAAITAVLNALRTLKGNTVTLICADLEGEEWLRVPNGLVGDGTPTYRTTPWTDIPGEKVYTLYRYDYTSDVLGAVTANTRIETNPATLRACQIAGATNAAVRNADSICNVSAAGLKPRHYIIQALQGADADNIEGKVIRNAYVSTITLARTAATQQNIANCAYCLGYKGESVKRIDLAIPAPVTP